MRLRQGEDGRKKWRCRKRWAREERDAPCAWANRRWTTRRRLGEAPRSWPVGRWRGSMTPPGRARGQRRAAMEQRRGVSGASTTKQARNRGGSGVRWKAKRREGRCVFAFALGGNDDRGGVRRHTTTTQHNSRSAARRGRRRTYRESWMLEKERERSEMGREKQLRRRSERKNQFCGTAEMRWRWMQAGTGAGARGAYSRSVGQWSVKSGLRGCWGIGQVG